MRTIFCCLFFALISCGEFEKRSYDIGIDPTFSFEGEVGSNLYGYVEEVLLEISKLRGNRFFITEERESGLLYNMERGKYEVIISKRELYIFDEKLYNFSDLIVNTSPVFVLSKDFKYSKIEDLRDKLIGVEDGSSFVKILERYPKIIMRGYPNIRKSLEDVKNGYLDGAILDGIVGRNIVGNIYYNTLKVSPPIFDRGLRFISKDPNVITFFNGAIEELERSGTLKEIKKKWNL